MYRQRQQIIGVTFTLLMITTAASTGALAAPTAGSETDRLTPATESLGTTPEPAFEPALGVAPVDQVTGNTSHQPVATASTLVVDPGNPDTFDTIQNAVDNATDGDTVEIRPDTYRERVSFNKSLTLTAPSGATMNGSTIDDPFFAEN